MVSLRVQASFLVLFLCQSLVLAAAVKEDTNNKHGNIQMPKSHRHQRRHLRETMERVKRSHLQKMQQKQQQQQQQGLHSRDDRRNDGPIGLVSGKVTSLVRGTPATTSTAFTSSGPHLKSSSSSRHRSSQSRLHRMSKSVSEDDSSNEPAEETGVTTEARRNLQVYDTFKANDNNNDGEDGRFGFGFVTQNNQGQPENTGGVLGDDDGYDDDDDEYYDCSDSGRLGFFKKIKKKKKKKKAESGKGKGGSKSKSKSSSKSSNKKKKKRRRAQASRSASDKRDCHSDWTHTRLGKVIEETDAAIDVYFRSRETEGVAHLQWPHHVKQNPWKDNNDG